MTKTWAGRYTSYRSGCKDFSFPSSEPISPFSVLSLIHFRQFKFFTLTSPIFFSPHWYGQQHHRTRHRPRLPLRSSSPELLESRCPLLLGSPSLQFVEYLRLPQQQTLCRTQWSWACGKARACRRKGKRFTNYIRIGGSRRSLRWYITTLNQFVTCHVGSIDFLLTEHLLELSNLFAMLLI